MRTNCVCKKTLFCYFFREFYFNGTIGPEDLKQFINLNSDVQFWFGTERMIEYLSPLTPVYHYLMYFQAGVHNTG